MEHLNRIIKAIRMMDSCRGKISEVADKTKLGNEGFAISLITKLVFEEDEKIYRVSSLPTAFQRVALSEFFKSLGCDIFLPERIVFETSWCAVTEQDKLREVFSNSEEKALEDICKCYPAQAKQIKSLFEEYKIKWFNVNNYGVDKDGRVKIFDYIANVNWSTHKKGLTRGDGTVVYKHDS